MITAKSNSLIGTTDDSVCKLKAKTRPVLENALRDALHKHVQTTDGEFMRPNQDVIITLSIKVVTDKKGNGYFEINHACAN